MSAHLTLVMLFLALCLTWDGSLFLLVTSHKEYHTVDKARNWSLKLITSTLALDDHCTALLGRMPRYSLVDGRTSKRVLVASRVSQSILNFLLLGVSLL